jgi:hypothetical protein
VRSYLTQLGQPDRPVVFVVDNEPPAPFQIYGYTKLTSNTSRYGLPPGQIDRGYLYLGSIDGFTRSAPTLTGERTYDRLSRGFLEDAKEGIARSKEPPVVVLDSAFNVSGANADLSPEDLRSTPTAPTVVMVEDGIVRPVGDGSQPASRPSDDEAGFWHVGVVLLGLLLLLLPGFLAIAWFVPRASLAEMLGMVPALALLLLVLIGIAVLAVARSPFSGTLAWVSLGLALLLGGALRLWSRRSIPRSGLTHGSSIS